MTTTSELFAGTKEWIVVQSEMIETYFGPENHVVVKLDSTGEVILDVSECMSTSQILCEFRDEIFKAIRNRQNETMQGQGSIVANG